MDTTFGEISSEQLKQYMAQQSEDQYELVDVRQTSEYKQGHIAGSRLLPLGELNARFTELPRDRDLIFYCRSGKRSRAAALFYTTNHPVEQQVYNLTGGIQAWSGLTLSDAPNLRAFTAPDMDLAATLYTGMDLERGAWNFYFGAMDLIKPGPLQQAVATLAQAEEGHARLLYNLWAPLQDEQPQPFRELYEQLPGAIMEGGQSVETILTYLRRQTEDLETILVEMALMVEHSAYDLYRALAHDQSGTEFEKVFLAIAQAEKEHMRIAADALRLIA
jgi:rhodanese-related sulfurtransferase/rubrerythrin